jgi:RNA polymerase sigma factor (sigma-70 family)
MRDQETLYRKWQEEDDQQALGSLVGSLEPIVQKKANEVTPPDLDENVVKNRIRNQIVEDLPDFDPDQSQLTTYLYNFSLPKVNRYIKTFQNTARIPEGRAQKISTFNNAVDEIRTDKGREPSDQELSDELGWDIDEVRRMRKSQRDELITSSVDMLGNFGATEHSEMDDVYHYMIYELDPEEQVVFKHLTGFDNTEKLSGKDIAEKMGVSPAKVSKIKNRINDKLQEYI